MTENKPPSAPRKEADDGSPKIYLLPNLMTAGNLFCGFLATLKILHGTLEVTVTGCRACHGSPNPGNSAPPLGLNSETGTETLAVGAHLPLAHTAGYTRMLGFLLDQQLDDGHVGVAHLLAGQEGAAVLHQAQATMAACLAEIGSTL